MKKLFLSVVVIITTLASCSKGNDDDVEDIITPELQKISFSTRNDTRASKTTDNLQDYAVYAQYTTAKADWFMDKLKLTHKDVIENGSIYYWPTPALDFYAYAPLTSDNIKNIAVANPTESTKGTVNISYTVPTNANDESFTVATPLIDRTASNGTVNFIFSRMMSKINITVSLDQKTITAGYTLNVKGATKLSVKSNSGTVDITDATPKWTTFPTDVEYITTTTNSVTTPSTAVTYFIMPYSTDGCVVTIEGVSITKGAEIIKYPLTYTFDKNSSVTAFEPGKQYNLNFEINVLTHATFTATIKKWVDAEIEGIL